MIDPPATLTASRRPARALSPRTVWTVAASTVSKAWHDRILGLSAESAFWQLLSLPSLVLALLGAVGFVGRHYGPRTLATVEKQILEVARDVLAPSAVNDVIEPILNQVLTKGRFDVVSIGGVLSLWAGSSAMATFVNTISIAYDQRDMRGAIRSRVLALWLYLVSLAILVVVLPLLVLGPSKLHQITPGSWRGATDEAVRYGFWPVLCGLLLLAVAALYHYATPVKLRWRRAWPGAALAVAVLVFGALGLRVYIAHITGRTAVYGVLAAPIAALLFFYILGFGVLLGAEFNATLERLWPRGRRPARMHRLSALLPARLRPHGPAQ